MDAFAGLAVVVIIVLLINYTIVAIIRKIQKKKIVPFKEQIRILQESYDKLNLETQGLQELQKKETLLNDSVLQKETLLNSVENKIKSLATEEQNADIKIQEIQSKVDLYSRLDDFVSYGFYETPQYLYETSERFAFEIKNVRDKQKELIKNGKVLELLKASTAVDISLSFIDKIYKSQQKLLIRTFNIECDLLIEKVNPSNLERTLNRITSLASELEKSSTLL